MKIGVAINETWAFFQDIYTELQRHHTVSVFEPRKHTLPIFRERLTRKLFEGDLSSFMRSNQAVFFEWSGQLLAAATQLPKTSPIVTRLHRYELYHWADKIDWNKVDRIIVVSEAKRHEFTARIKGQEHKLVVVPESVSLKRFLPVERRFNRDIGTLCNLTPRKRVYELILAFVDLGLHQKGYRLHIGGGEHERFKDYYDALISLPERLGVNERVIFYGKIDDSLGFYRNLDIFISNSYSEGLQVSPIESIASGCYCLSHHWPGAAELLPAENLFMTDSELGQRLEIYEGLSEAERREKRDRLRQHIVSRFDGEKISLQIRQIIEEAARG
ncbi:MAG: glycosyltransferase family 4 protein [Chloroflexota bacterium]|jgi:glycosyltransferase involved in cell wall biosynthesis